MGTPTIWKRPSAPVLAVRPPGAVTVAPATGPLLPSTTSPITCVSGSGATATVTPAATPSLPPRSRASAPSARLLTPLGTVKVYW